MPSLAEHFAQPNSSQLRIMLYGPSQTKKTMWAGRAAEAGFNVLYLDCDGNPQTLGLMSPEAQARVDYFNIMDGFDRPVAAWFVTRLLKGKPFDWDYVGRDFVFPAAKCDTRVTVDLSKLDRNWVLVLDSYTAFVWSLMVQFNIENQLDMSKVEKPDDSWGGYRWCGALATWAIKQMKALPCHVIVIGHQDVYEKRATVMEQGKKVQKVEWTRLQMKSTSGPHAMQVAKEFTDVFYFYLHNQSVKINTGPADDRDGGSRRDPGRIYNWDEFQFAHLCQLNNIPLPNGVAAVPLSPPKPTSTTAPGTLGALFAKK